MCEAECWEDALLELKRQNYAPDVKKVETRWLAVIYLGMKEYDRVLELKAQAKEDGCNIDTFLAVAYARKGRHEKALHLAREAARLKRDGANHALGHVYFAAGDYARASWWYEQDADSFLHRSTALRHISKTLLALQDFREARVVCEQVIRHSGFLRPEDLLRLAECLRQTGQAQQAAQWEQLAQEKA